MRSASINAPITQPQGEKAEVWFGGSTALLEGQAVCFNWDYGTATASDGSRMNRVEVPTILNAPYFAGVSAHAYAANTGGRMIEIWLPGSLCNVLTKIDSVIGVGRLTFECGGTYAGYFRYEGFAGQGSCIPMQTATNASTAGNCMAMLETGPQSGGVEVVDLVTGAVTLMVGGVTHFPAATIASADATFTVADGTLNGQRKGFHCIGALTTNSIVITFTSGIQPDGATALATWTAETATDEITVEWRGTGTAGVWVEIQEIGGTVA